MNVINFSQPITGNFLVDVILWLVTTTGSVALGIVLFTVILKLITLPFDIISRRSMRKNTILMEQMRPELERLQKQYSNNKDLYNQKMMALYKKNGYSMMGSCLPTIFTLVIFIVAINGFTAYSQYQNRVYFYEMSKAYNSVIYDGFDKDGEHIFVNEEGKLVIDDNYFYSKLEGSDKIENTKITSVVKHGVKGVTVYTDNGFIKYSVTFDNATNEIISEEYELIEKNLFNESTFNSSSTINSGFELDDIYIKQSVVDGKKVIVFNDIELYNKAKNNENAITAGDHTINVSILGRTMTVNTENGYIRYQNDFIIENNEVKFGTPKYTIIKDKLFNEKATQKEGTSLYFGLELDSTYITKGSDNKFSVNFDALKLATEKSEILGEITVKYAKTDLGYSLYTEGGYIKYFREVTDSEETSFNNVSFGVLAENLVDVTNTHGKKFIETEFTPEDFIKDIQGEKAATAFRNEKTGFLWVKNIWVTDGAHKHPILDYEEFKTTVAETEGGCGCSCNQEIKVPISEQEYNNLTAKLNFEKTTANGFYILCILSALISLASQLIMTKSQKAQLELQTVDGQGASNQKMMTWMMPAMMAIFSFIYTSAFSIYIIINTSLGILTTLLINKAVDKKFSKLNVAKSVVRGRVYNKKEEPVEDKKAKNNKNKKEEAPKTNDKDFLSGLADGKRPTKKIKKK